MSTPREPPQAAGKDRVLALVVERSPIVQSLQQFFLEQAGFTVEFAHDGVSALARAWEIRPAILITEVLVPKMDGLTLCQTVKSQAETRNIIVLIISHLESEKRAREAGCDAFLLKPFTEDRLVVTLRMLVAKHERLLRGTA